MMAFYMVYRKFLNEYAFSYIKGNEIPGNELFRKSMISLHVKQHVIFTHESITVAMAT